MALQTKEREPISRVTDFLARRVANKKKDQFYWRWCYARTASPYLIIGRASDKERPVLFDDDEERKFWFAIDIS